MQKTTPEMDSEESEKAKQEVINTLLDPESDEARKRKEKKLKDKLEEISDELPSPEAVSQVEAKEALQQSKLFLELAESARDMEGMMSRIELAKAYALQSIAQSLINYLDPPF